jgi:hypothetical protein
VQLERVAVFIKAVSAVRDIIDKAILSFSILVFNVQCSGIFVVGIVESIG